VIFQDIQILQDFYMLLTTANIAASKKFKLTADEASWSELSLVNEKIIKQVNNYDQFDNFEYYAKFISKNVDALIEFFDQILKL
jgi:hypothetical protein